MPEHMTEDESERWEHLLGVYEDTLGHLAMECLNSMSPASKQVLDDLMKISARIFFTTKLQPLIVSAGLVQTARVAVWACAQTIPGPQASRTLRKNRMTEDELKGQAHDICDAMRELGVYAVRLLKTANAECGPEIERAILSETLKLHFSAELVPWSITIDLVGEQVDTRVMLLTCTATPGIFAH
jgi:hypothetical protein